MVPVVSEVPYLSLHTTWSFLAAGNIRTQFKYRLLRPSSNTSAGNLSRASSQAPWRGDLSILCNPWRSEAPCSTSASSQSLLQSHTLSSTWERSQDVTDTKLGTTVSQRRRTTCAPPQSNPWGRANYICCTLNTKPAEQNHQKCISGCSQESGNITWHNSYTKTDHQRHTANPGTCGHTTTSNFTKNNCSTVMWYF